jgi:hypothetical protein
MTRLDFILPLVSEWPFGPPRYPVKKVVCAVCEKEIWLEITPDYLLLVNKDAKVRFVCTDCARPKAGGS